jgi:hypothetical protein
MSTIKADAIEAATGTNTDLVLTGKGTGVPDIETGFKVSGTVGLPLSDLRVGTAGNLITYDASGDPAAVATGTAAQLLTSNGAGAAPTFQDAPASGRHVLIEGRAMSGNTTESFTGLTGYDDYVFVLSGITFGGDTAEILMRYSTNNGSSYVSSSTYYNQQLGVGGGGQVIGVANETSLEIGGLQTHIGSNINAASGCHAEVYLPAFNGSAQKNFFSRCTWLTSGSPGLRFVSSRPNITTACNAVQFSNTGGQTMSGGHIAAYGVTY